MGINKISTVRTSESTRIKAWKPGYFSPHGDCAFSANAKDVDLIVVSKLTGFFISHRSLGNVKKKILAMVTGYFL